MINKLRAKWNNTPLAIKVSSAYAICNILQKCLSFITLPLFTRLLTTEQYGQFTIYSSWSGILVLFLTLNLAYGSFQTAMIKYENQRAEYISSIQGICIILACIFLLIYIPFKEAWNKLFELPTYLVLLMVVEIIFFTSTQLWMGRNRFEFKYKSVVAITLFTSILSPMSGLTLVFFSEEKGHARIIGYAIVNIIIGAFFFIKNASITKMRINKELVSFALRFNIPLLVYYLSQVVFNHSDRIMISHMVGISEAAIYGVACNLAMVLTFVLNSINGSYVPWLYRKIKEGRANENKIVSSMLIFLIGILILGVIWFAPEIILIMAGDHYQSATSVVAPVAMSLFLLFYCQLFINVEFYYEEKKMLVYGSIGAAAINIILNYYMIPVYGFFAAGYTTLVGYVVFALSNFIAMKLVIKKKSLIDNLFDYNKILIYFVSFFILSFIGVSLYSCFVARFILVIIVFVVLTLNMDKFKVKLKQIRGDG